jgi:hypothetical protein
MSPPPGGDVGGDEGVAGTPGKENISVAGGNEGTPAGAATRPPSEKPGGEATGSGGAVPGAPGTSAVTPASEAGIARRSASVSWPTCGDVGGAETPGGVTAGTFGKEKAFQFGGKVGTPPNGAPLSPSRMEADEPAGGCGATSGVSGRPTAPGDGTPPAAFGSAEFPGRAAKNSFASLAITAGSGNEANPVNGCGNASASGASVATRSLVLVILVDIDVLQYSDGVLSEDRDRAVERD